MLASKSNAHLAGFNLWVKVTHAEECIEVSGAVKVSRWSWHSFSWFSYDFLISMTKEGWQLFHCNLHLCTQVHHHIKKKEKNLFILKNKRGMRTLSVAHAASAHSFSCECTYSARYESVWLWCLRKSMLGPVNQITCTDTGLSKEIKCHQWIQNSQILPLLPPRRGLEKFSSALIKE